MKENISWFSIGKGLFFFFFFLFFFTICYDEKIKKRKTKILNVHASPPWDFYRPIEIQAIYIFLPSR